MLAADLYCLRKKTALTQPRSRALAAHDVDLAQEKDQTSSAGSWRVCCGVNEECTKIKCC